MINYFLENKNLMKISLICFLANLLLVNPGLAQSPYKTNTFFKEGIIIGSGLATFGFAHWKLKRTSALTEAQIMACSKEDVFALDRYSLNHYNEKSRKLSDRILFSSFAIPFTLLAVNKTRDDFGKVGLFLAQSIIVNTALTDLAKSFAKRKRPFVYNAMVDLPPKLEKDARASFYSGHTSTVAAMYFLTAKIYADFHPESKFRPVVWTAAVLIPATQGFLRMNGGKHFLTDVLTGFVMGSVIGFLIPEIHKIGN